MDKQKIIAMSAPVVIKAAEGEGESKGPPKFDVTAYNGGKLNVGGWDLPVVIDLAGLTLARSVVANFGHDESQPVGHVTDHEITENSLRLAGVFSFDDDAATRKILNGAKNKFPWEASVEVYPDEYVEVEAGQTVEANGQTFEGPLYMTRKGTLYGFGFVLHGADATTSVAIAASAAPRKETKTMSDEFKTWAENMLPGVDIDAMPEQARTNLQADFEGRKGERVKVVAAVAGDRLGKKRIEATRRKEINAMAEEWCDRAIEMARYEDVEAIHDARDSAITAGTSISDFKYELQIATLTQAPPAIHVNRRVMNDKVLEAAICQHGKLATIDKHFDDQIQQLAHDEYKGRISLSDVYLAGAQANGYNSRTGRVDVEMHNAAFGLGLGIGRQMIKGFGFSTINLPNVFSNVANKFIREGWMSVDQTALRIAAIRSVSDFKAITTVSLTGGMQFLPIGPDGELKHGELGEQTYSNQVAPAGIMFAITFVDIRNDDIGALTAVPRRIGRGGMLYLNHIFWTEFLNNGSFFAAGNNNVNTGVANMTVGGLAATETIFRDQTDYDGKPLASDPAIILVPTPLRADAETLRVSQFLINGTTTQGAVNIFQNRFRVESSPYMSNSAYTGFSAAAWYMLADPNDVPVIEIAALDGQVQPTVETADAAFNVLGTQMRGHSHVGVNLQEPKGGVRADGGAS